MKITNMQTNGVTCPLGFNFDSLRLSWITESHTSLYQTAARVEISTDKQFGSIVFDSGKDESISSLAFSPDLDLSPRTRYYWRVTVWDDNDKATTGDVHWFETSKLDEKWDAEWITPDNIDNGTHPLIRKSFQAKKRIKQVRVYTTGLGLYELYINGKKADNEVLKPGFHSYNHWVQYYTFEADDQVKPGENTIGFALGNGWYKGKFGLDGGKENIYGDSFLLIAEIIITYEDGSEETIGTNETWKWRAAPITFSGIYDGEIFNANLEDPEWCTAKYDALQWGNMRIDSQVSLNLEDRYSPQILIKEFVSPVEIIETPNNETVLDMGQNMTGWLRFNSQEKQGQKIVLEYGEILQDGSFYRDNLRAAEAKYTYISDGQDRTVEPSFTFFGFRYVKISGFEQMNVNDFIGCVIYSDLKQIGEVHTSDSRVNRLFENALWSQKGNFLDVPTDCPQRDERLGWTGDAQIFAPTASMNMQTQAFFRKYLKDLREEQLRLNGAVPFIVPEIYPPNEAPSFLALSSKGSTAWSDAATIIPWTLYQQYGDKQLLKEHYPIMKDWTEYLYNSDEQTKGYRLLTEGFHFGDWLALDGTKQFDEDRFGGTDIYFIATGYYYYSVLLTARAAKAINRQGDADKYTKLAKEIKEAFIAEYFSLNGRCVIQTQTAHIFALYLDLIPSGSKERVQNDLRQLLAKNKNYLQTGFVGTPYINHVLTDNQMEDIAYTLLLNNKYPSWLYEVELGATTVWERWDSVFPDGKLSSTGMNSLNHYAYGSIVEWMYKKMCGIMPDEDHPGYKKFHLTPTPSWQLTHAYASINTSSGKIGCGWEIIEQRHLKICCDVPFDTSAMLTLPVKEHQKLYLNGEALSEDFIIERKKDKIIVELYRGSYEFYCEYFNDFYHEKYNSQQSLEKLFAHQGFRDKLLEEFPQIVNDEVVWTSYYQKTLHEIMNLPFIKEQFTEAVWKEKIHTIDELFHPQHSLS